MNCVLYSGTPKPVDKKNDPPLQLDRQIDSVVLPCWLDDQATRLVIPINRMSQTNAVLHLEVSVLPLRQSTAQVRGICQKKILPAGQAVPEQQRVTC